MKRLSALILCLILTASLTTTALAYAPDELVGEVASLLQGTNDPGPKISSMPLGSAAADALAAAAGTQLAIVNGGDIVQNLQGGEATWGDVLAVFKEDRPVAVTTVTAAQLKAILEVTAANFVTGEDDCLIQAQSESDAFVQPSGFTYRLDGSAPANGRVFEIEIDGEELDLTDETTTYTLAASEYMLSGGFGMPVFDYELTEYTLATAMVKAMQEGTLTVPDEQRAYIVGTADDRIIDMFPIGVVILAAVLIAVFNHSKNTRYDYTRMNWRNEQGYERKEYIQNK